MEYLLAHDQATEAWRAAERARGMLYVPPGSQLEGEFDKLFRKLKPSAPPTR